jgi:hypothetical protein
MEIFEIKWEKDKETIEDFLTYVRFRFPTQEIEIVPGGARVKILKKNDLTAVKNKDNNAGWDEEDNVHEYKQSTRKKFGRS